MITTDGTAVNPPIRLRRGQRGKSSDPAFRRDTAMGHLAERRAELIRAGQRRVVRLALEGKTVTADDLRVIDPGAIHRHFAGAVFRLLKAAGILAPVGYVQSTVPASHARPILSWRLADAVAAREWLQTHQDPDPLATVVQRTLFAEAGA